eukprot:13166646-Heterocapsa_arctica.AAC.2
METRACSRTASRKPPMLMSSKPASKWPPSGAQLCNTRFTAARRCSVSSISEPVPPRPRAPPPARMSRTPATSTLVSQSDDVMLSSDTRSASSASAIQVASAPTTLV